MCKGVKDFYLRIFLVFLDFLPPLDERDDDERYDDDLSEDDQDEDGDQEEEDDLSEEEGDEPDGNNTRVPLSYNFGSNTLSVLSAKKNLLIL